MKKSEWETLVKAIAPPIVEILKRTVDPLKARIAALEQRATLKYCGIHQPELVYRKAAFARRAAACGLRPDRRPAGLAAMIQAGV